jgi:catechol 2,3-dioxygenase-like lactoylglutathione lyase family enzyme
MLKIQSIIKSRSFMYSMLVLLFSIPLISFAQLASPNRDGVSMGHLHFLAADLEASNEFWEAFGASTVQNGPLSMHAVPGVFILVREVQPSSGSDGTMIVHVGFHVPNVNAAFDRWTAAGIDVERGAFPIQLWVHGPDGLLIEILENPEIDVPVQMHHIHWNIPEIEAMQAWYDDMFGAVPGMRGDFQAGDIPGVNLTFSGADMPLANTQGTVLDHIGFEVTDLQATIARLEAAGVSMDSGYREIPAANLAIAFLTDPWGTYIELTQGIEP